MVKAVLVSLAFGVLHVSMVSAQEGNWKQFSDPTSKARGNCPECADGEAMASAAVTIPHGVYVDIDNPPCGDAKFNAPSMSADMKASAAALFYAQPVAAGAFALGLGDQVLGQLVQVGVNDAGTFGQLMRKFTNQPQVANCARAVVVLPKTVTITRIVKHCESYMGGWCGWVGEPTTDEVDANLFAVSGVGKNWSHDRSATISIKVFYKR